MTSFVYILEQTSCEGDPSSNDDDDIQPTPPISGGKPRFYVGITGDIMKRLGEHITGRGAEWTKKFPFKRLHHAESFSGKTKAEMEAIENSFTLKVMSVRGIENTRGGKWANIRLTKAEIDEIITLCKPTPGVCLICGKKDHGPCEFNNLAYNQPSFAQQENKPSFTPTVARKLPGQATVKRAFHCSRCGYPGHKINQCRVRKSIDGVELGLNPAIECVKCGRGNHTADVCRARFHKDGNELIADTGTK